MDHAIRIVIMIAALGFSVIFHEMAHAWSAWKMGDPTGKNDNRLKWNPMYHIDPFMTILLPLLLYVSSAGKFMFGGAKPVQINPLNFQNPGRGMMISAAAGPFSNFVLGFVAFGLLFLLVNVAPGTVVQETSPDVYQATWNGYFFLYFMLINFILGTFNLIPIPPLDGSRVLRYLLPRDGKAFVDRIEPFGLWIILAIVMLGGFGKIIMPIYELMLRVLAASFDGGIALAFWKILIGAE